MIINLKLEDVTEGNKVEKFERAVKALSNQLKIPATIKNKESVKEKYPTQAQEDIYQFYKVLFGELMDDLYSRVCATLDMKPANTFRKAIDPNAPSLGKVILWNPETGKQISQKDIDKLLNSVDRYMNRNIKKLSKEFTISESAVARIIANLKRNYPEVVKDSLNNIVYEKKRWDYFDSYKKLDEVFPDNYNRLKFRERVVGNYITDINESSRKKIRDTLDQGFLAGKSKSEISQELFDKFGDMNKDWDRIVDTEGVNIFNSEYIEEQKKEALSDEPIYFIRREFLDKKTCSFCEGANNTVIAKWSDTTLQDENIDDPVASIAIWAGKTNYGRNRASWWWAEGSIHPNCRGQWDRYYPEVGDFKL